MKKMLILIAAALSAAFSFAAFDVAQLQKMIDEASAKGGGTVTVPAGTWETGPIALKSNVTLHLDKGATLLGNPDPAVYRKAKLSALVHTEKAENVAIEGEGTLDGRGGMMPSAVSRPHLVNFRDCRNVRVEGVTLRCGGSWTLNPLRCDGVVIRGVKIWSHVNHCEDGIDISSKNVLIEDCEVDADDDALVFKTTSPDVEVENVMVRNCRLRSSCNAIKFGTESHGLMRNVKISGCTISAPSAQGRFDWRSASQGITEYLTGLAGIAVECVDGETLENIEIRDIRMTGMQTPIFIRLGRRNAPRMEREACLRNVLIENVIARAESRIACSITGVPGLRPQGVTIRNVKLAFPGGGTAVDAATPVPEVEKGYPDAHMFHGLPLPAYGFYIRHADGVKLENVTLKALSEDARPAVVIDDADVVTDIKDVRRVGEGTAEGVMKRFWDSLTREDGYFYLPPTKPGIRPPLCVCLGAVRGVPPADALAECRRRGWAMLTPFARDAKGVLAAIGKVKDRIDASRIYLKGDAAMASVALATVAAAPQLFAGVSAVMPMDEVKGLDKAKGTPVDITTAMKNGRVKYALGAFADAVGPVIPAEVSAAILERAEVPKKYRFAGEHGDFPRKARPLAYQVESGSSRLSITDTSGVSMFAPSFNWFAKLPPRRIDGGGAVATRRLILVGDSTLQRRSAGDKAGSWGEALKDDLAEDFEIVNCAIGGRSTKTYMPEWLTNTVNRIRPGDWVIVQFGHNDMSKASDPKIDRQTDPDTEYMNNLLRFVADIRYHGGQPLLVTSISLYLYNKDPDKWPDRNPLGRWTAAMKRIAVEHNVPCVDLNAVSLAAVRDAGSAVSSKWYMFSVNGKDWAHPTKLGAKTIAKLFMSEVRRERGLPLELLKDKAFDGISVTLTADGTVESAIGAEISEVVASRDAGGNANLKFRFTPKREGANWHLKVRGLHPHNWTVNNETWMLGKWLYSELEDGVDLGVQEAGVYEIGKRWGPQKPGNWPEWKAMMRQVKSTFDGTMQPCYFWAPEKAKTEAVPLIVGLHTWSADWRQTGHYATVLKSAKERGWAMVGPNFRGPNDHPEACGGDAAVQDVVDAVNYAKAQVRIDPKRVYIIGGSGGGHLTLLMAGRHPEIWAGCAAFCPITDLARWHADSILAHPGRDKAYAKMMEGACGGTPAEKAKDYRHRSPLTWLGRARKAGVPVYIVTGIHDGWTGSVPVGHSFRAFNALAAESDRVSEADIAAIEADQKVPETIAYRGPADPFYGEKLKIHFRRTSANVRFTLFEGGHGGNFAAGLDFCARQVKGKPADFTIPGSGVKGSEEKLGR